MKNIITNVLLFSAMALPVFTSCSSDDETKAEVNKNLLEIEVLGNAQTKAYSPLYNSIPSKSYYGIYLADNDNNVVSNCNNVSVYYNAGNSIISQPVELNTNDRRVFAYYPYNNSINPSNLELEGVMAGQDVMIGKSVEIQNDNVYSSGYVNSAMNKAFLKLTHAKSCITFYITQEETWTKHHVESVSIQVPIRYKAIDLFSGKYVGDTDADIEPNVLNSYTHLGEFLKCNFLVAPTVKECDIYASMIVDGVNTNVKLPISSLEPGKEYIFNVLVRKNAFLEIRSTNIVSRDEEDSSSMDWEIEY